jgi:hypothetical protein
MMKKSLKGYTNTELFETLKHNETLTALELSGFCSEILRRQIYLYEKYQESIKQVNEEASSISSA